MVKDASGKTFSELISGPSEGKSEVVFALAARLFNREITEDGEFKDAEGATWTIDAEEFREALTKT